MPNHPRLPAKRGGSPFCCYGAIRLLIGTVVLALVLRTWLVMGLIVPVTVSGHSMAPTLLGPHYAPRCPKCRETICVSVDSFPAAQRLKCPYCGDADVSYDSANLQPGARLWIDRTVAGAHEVERWELVVFRCHDSTDSGSVGRLCIKRVIGLPGERIQLERGDVVINGQVQVKSLAEQRAMRILVARGQNHFFDLSNRKPVAMTPLFKGNHQTTDNYVYNANLSRRLTRVRDLMLSANITCAGSGQLALDVDGGWQGLRMLVCPVAGTFRLYQHGELIASQMLSPSSQRRLAQGEVLLEVSTFDRQLLLAIDGHVEYQLPLASNVSQVATTEPFAIGANGLQVTVGQPTLWRDIYYTAQPVGIVRTEPLGQDHQLPTWHLAPTWQLANGELFLLGDNAPISVDSRVWAPAGVPVRLLIGRPIGIR